jgi:RNA polymerase sigma-70 factor (ECF subfamily)
VASPSNADERSLVEAAQKDPARFADLYEANVDRVYAYIRRRVRDRAEAEDLTSAVFHQALAHLPRFEWRGITFAAWLLRIAANAVIDRWHSSRREANDLGPEDSTAAEAPSIERSVMLSQLVDSLPPDQRQVIVDRFVEQRSIREIAETLGRSEGAIKQLQFRALTTLRAHLEKSNG